MAVWRVVCSGTLYAVEKWANVFHINPAGTFNHAEVLDAFESVYSQDASGGGSGWLKPCKGIAIAGETPGVHMDKLSLQRVIDPGIPEERLVSHDGGQNTAGGLPLQMSLVVSWRTALAGRSFRGRTYLPPWHENKNDDAGNTLPHPDLATVQAVRVNAEKLLADLLAADAVLVVYSSKLAQANTITGGYIDHSWDVQRRRADSIPAGRTVITGP